jgi:hypothetical protein
VNPKEAFGNFIIGNIHTDTDKLPDISEVVALPEQTLSLYVQKLANNDTDFSSALSQVDKNLPLEEQFSLAMQEYMSEPTRKLRETHAKLNEALWAPFKEVINFAGRTGSFFGSPIDSTQNIYEPIKKIVSAVSKIGLQIAESLQQLDISEERQKELLASHKKWGEYGWTMPPRAEFSLFNSTPASSEEANKDALQYCREQDMESLFSDLRSECPRKNDLEEAIFCYKSKKYKACALVLFSIIDSLNIRKQPRKLSSKRKVGVGAIAEVKELIDPDELFLTLLQAENVLKCSFEMFADADDFTLKTQVINRNYLMHGMSSSRVRKRDCIQLFLLLYNLLHVLGYIED